MPLPQLHKGVLGTAAVLCWGAGAFVALLVALARRWRRRRFVPGPWHYQPQVDPRRLPGAFSPEAIEDIVRSLQRVREVEGDDELDVDSTVEATIESGGFPAPQYRAPLLPPVYVVAQDRSPSTHPWAPIYDELFDEVAASGIPVSRLEYWEVPDSCAPAAWVSRTGVIRGSRRRRSASPGRGRAPGRLRRSHPTR